MRKKKQKGVTGIDKAIEQAGGQVKLAYELGVSQQAISLWQRQGWVPNSRVVEISSQYGIPRNKLINPKVFDLVFPVVFE